MFGRRLVDGESADWQFEQFEWMIDNFSSGPGLPDSELWQPIPQHFPKPEGELGPHLFNIVCRQCDFDPANFELISVEPVKSQSLGGLALSHPTVPAPIGTYQIEGEDDANLREIIQYDMSQPSLGLVATFAHELSHSLFYRSYEPWPGDMDMHELFTDLIAIYLGYGIFLSNTRFNFSGFTGTGIQGWQVSGAGYLPEADMIFALALFMRLKNIPDTVATIHLKPKLAKMLRKAMRQLDRESDRVEALRSRIPSHAQPKSELS